MNYPTPSPPASVGAVAHKPVNAATRRWLPRLINELEHGPPLTPSDEAECRHRLASYAKTGPQQGLPFTTDKDAK